MPQDSGEEGWMGCAAGRRRAGWAPAPIRLRAPPPSGRTDRVKLASCCGRRPQTIPPYEPCQPEVPVGFDEVMEPKGETKVDGVRMAMGVLDCPVCYEPLCLRFTRLNKCTICARTGFERVESVEVSCCFAKNGCTKKITYFNMKTHEKACLHGPCLCPEPGCDFTGPSVALPNHLTTHHKWPSTVFKYFERFNLHLQAGPRVLHALDGNVFVMNVVTVAPLGHAISLVCVQPEGMNSRFGCSVVFSCFTCHHQISTLDAVRSSSLSDGLPDDSFCFVPKASGGATNVVLRTTHHRYRVGV
ncbi:hypothetical protein BAE44_0002773 [Dichanthelium oligosanthes]|uniref:SIAH-type domain-containing protein n=1 Tax=Dichanthelium oligosanthes TaxID=888268 RepID=A0A1E5WFL9_9POAL|nr:hypothetical protein BAE44_0002773 [Dichanthelium oligosanthes]